MRKIVRIYNTYVMYSYVWHMRTYKPLKEWNLYYPKSKIDDVWQTFYYM